MLTHHAYYIEDSLSLWEEYQNAIRVTQEFEMHDPRFAARSYEKFGIDEARELTQLASLKNDRALFFVTAASITSEAQQALLKLLEEPQEGTVFVLLVPHGILLPTLRSRMLAYSDRISQTNSNATAKEFLSSSYKKRSDWIAATLKKEDDAREVVRSFFTELESELYAKLPQSKAPEQQEIRAGLEDIMHFRQYLGDRAPSLKMLLEHFAATLPIVR